MRTDKKRISKLVLQSVAMTLIVILFFLGVITFYYSMLYSKTREEIVKSGELSAEESASQIDKQLLIGIETMRLECYSLNKMIRSGKSQEEIGEFLVNQSSAISSVTNNYATGLYGYINGEYLDGTGWTPDADYAPTERPWYIDARANIGRVAVVDPYIDSMTGTVMISLSKTLCDAKSVAAMDFSLERLQTIVEQVAQGESDAEIVLDRKYQVIAHSDRAEVGRNYLADKDTFGSALVEKLRTTDDGYFSMHYKGADYIIYTVPVANDWLCLAVFDATNEFNQLKNVLFFTIVVSILVVSVLLAIMMHMSRKTVIAEQLRENLSHAESNIREKEGQIGEIRKVAFCDALTGVGSKAAFNQLSDELTADIAAGERALAVMMVDVNDLKYVNDTCGHDKGDEYLRGCCRIICQTYKHSPVFRIGGDEFVAVLRNSDFEERAALAAQLCAAFKLAYSDAQKAPWERYSAAAGMAECEAGDTTFEQVFKRADRAMYESKQAFKAQHGSYR